MTKAAIIISAILLFAGVAAASSLTSIGGSDTPTVEHAAIHLDRRRATTGRRTSAGPKTSGARATKPSTRTILGAPAPPAPRPAATTAIATTAGPATTDDSGHGDGNRGGSSGPGGGGHDD